jgi:hypothetical protein
MFSSPRDPCGDTLTRVVANAVPMRAVIPVTPEARAVTCPLRSTCATASLSLAHATVTGASFVVTVTTAWTVTVSPTLSDTAAGRFITCIAACA